MGWRIRKNAAQPFVDGNDCFIVRLRIREYFGVILMAQAYITSMFGKVTCCLKLMHESQWQILVDQKTPTYCAW